MPFLDLGLMATYGHNMAAAKVSLVQGLGPKVLPQFAAQFEH